VRLHADLLTPVQTGFTSCSNATISDASLWDESAEARVMWRLIVAIAVVFAAAVFLGYSLLKPSGDWRQTYVPPIENADGTIDYTLVDKPRKESGGTYWILRLQKDWDVKQSESEDPSAARPPNKIVASLKAISNDHLIIEFAYQTLEPARHSAPKEAEELFKLIAQSDPRLSLSNEEFETLIRNTDQHCDKRGEATFGVVEYAVRKPEKVHDAGCFVGWDSKLRGFIVFDGASQYLAKFSCIDPGKSGFGGCWGDIELKNGLVASFSSKAREAITPQKLRDFTFFARDFFEKNTVQVLKLKPEEKFKR
jgi:hypothetical protein